jgi:CubicO group peptidase (beta-lactamase class C family)
LRISRSRLVDMKEVARRTLAEIEQALCETHARLLVLARGFGIVDLAEGTPVAVDTPYPVASLTRTRRPCC